MFHRGCHKSGPILKGVKRIGMPHVGSDPERVRLANNREIKVHDSADDDERERTIRGKKEQELSAETVMLSILFVKLRLRMYTVA